MSMKLQQARALLARRFRESCLQGQGGPREADALLNGACRSVVRACYREYGEAWLGRVNFYPERPEIVRPWKPGTFVPSFSAEFVLPVASEEVILLVARYRRAPLERAAEWTAMLAEIDDAIGRAGGVMLPWS